MAISNQPRINRDQATVLEFGAHIPPAIRVKPGELFVVETHDTMWEFVSYQGIEPTPENLEVLRHEYFKVNPLAGPIYVEGLKAGDQLIVEIEDIIPVERGFTGAGPTTFGVMSNRTAFPELNRTISHVTYHRPGPSGTTSDGTGLMKMKRDVVYRLHPFLGTIVTAPERGIENSLITQGPWGGNIDAHDVCKGNKIIMNTSHDGGLLFFGDAHASQADGENGFADESGAEVRARCYIGQHKRIPGVARIETPTSLIQLDSGRNAGSIERALDSAFVGLFRWLVEDYGMDPEEVCMHFTVNPDVVIKTYQFVSGFYTGGVAFPKSAI